MILYELGRWNLLFKKGFNESVQTGKVEFVVKQRLR